MLKLGQHHLCRWSTFLQKLPSPPLSLLYYQPYPFGHLPARLQIGNRANLISSTSTITAKPSSPWPLFTVSTPLALEESSSHPQRHFVHFSFNLAKAQLHGLTVYRSASRQAFSYCPRHCLQPSLHPRRPRPSLWRYIPQIQGS
jgi:hypothetical protein